MKDQEKDSIRKLVRESERTSAITGWPMDAQVIWLDELLTLVEGQAAEIERLRHEKPTKEPKPAPDDKQCPCGEKVFKYCTRYDCWQIDPAKYEANQRAVDPGVGD